jgi:Alpha-L-arabinofuranosidase B (ABFB) domain
MTFLSLQSFNFPDRFIRHRNFLGEITQIQSDLDKQDATFYIFGGNFFFGRVVHLQSASPSFIDFVLRHQDFRLKLQEFSGVLDSGPETPEHKLLRDDASFTLVNGLANPGDLGLLSFRSVNFPDRFIRHRDFHLFVEKVDSTLAGNDATFRFANPFAVPHF